MCDRPSAQSVQSVQRALLRTQSVPQLQAECLALHSAHLLPASKSCAHPVCQLPDLSRACPPYPHSCTGSKAAERLAAPSVPTLLTLTADGVARVWVPVTLVAHAQLRAELPPNAAAAVAFCVALVVNPPAPEAGLG